MYTVFFFLLINRPFLSDTRHMKLLTCDINLQLFISTPDDQNCNVSMIQNRDRYFIYVRTSYHSPANA